jgi:dTDP-L-rhamnose 4-epimerase
VVAPIGCQETTPCRPISVYGFTKKMQEDIFSIISSTYKVPVVILRYFNVFGAGQSISNPYTGILTLFCSRLLRDMNIEVYEDGKMQRDFIHIEDVVRANTRALELDTSGVLVLNVGSGTSKTILQVAESLKAEIGSKSNVNLTGRYRLGDIRHCYADMSNANTIIGKARNDSFKHGIRQLITWATDCQSIAKLERPIQELSMMGLTGLANNACNGENR